MYRLAELTDKRRKQIGGGMLFAGLVGLVLGVIVIHWSSFPETEVVNGVEVPVVLDFMNWFPRGGLWLGIGYLIVLGAVTLALVGGAMLWVLNQPMTWTRASIGQGPPPSNEKFGDTSLERSRCWASPYFASYSRTSRVRAAWRWVPLRRDLSGFRCFSCPIRADVMPITPTM